MSIILQRQGLSRPRKRIRRKAMPSTQPFGDCAGPNDTWCIDFKGKFRTQDGRWCHVLTLLDAWSRYLLRCEAVLDPDGVAVERILDSAFQEFGLPAAMRSDNGPPFASTGAAGLTKLSVWWLQLGIRLERIEPGEPQQNGRLERAHLTLEEIVATPAQDVMAQQRELGPWRREYNEERPHQALGQRPPAHLTNPQRDGIRASSCARSPPPGTTSAASRMTAASAGTAASCTSPMHSLERTSNWSAIPRQRGSSATAHWS